MDTPGDDSIESKLLAWLQAEGYPLEFATAQAFRSAGFSVRQGYYTQPRDDKPAREIDVVASRDIRKQGRPRFLRVEHVVECKWSGDKPWVLFCGGSGITTAACATQMIASELGQALLWKDAGHEVFASLELFRSSDRPAFGGRQGFSGTRDILFDALRSVTSAARLVAEEYDRIDTEDTVVRLPEFGVVVLPLIVIEGRLFEVRQDNDSGTLALSEVAYSRIHWRGAGRRPHAHTTVDVVCSNNLKDFLNGRSEDVRNLLAIMSSSTDELLHCISEGSLSGLNVTRGSRGIVGSPQLIRRLRKSLSSPPHVDT